jgi:hypothetical protein
MRERGSALKTAIFVMRMGKFAVRLPCAAHSLHGD